MEATRAQLGNATAPEAHSSDAVPAAVLAVDYDGDELPQPMPSGIIAARGWRSRELRGPMAGPSSDVAVPELVTIHGRPGDPDPRRGQNTQQKQLPAIDPQPEARQNSRLPVDINTQAAPSRFRGGFTGEDEARPAATSRSLFARAFDQWAAQSIGTRAALPSPVALLPLNQTDDVDGALPSNAPGFADRKAGIGVQPNTFRLLPRAWDADALNTNPNDVDVAQQAASNQARKGWRA